MYACVVDNKFEGYMYSAYLHVYLYTYFALGGWLRVKGREPMNLLSLRGRVTSIRYTICIFSPLCPFAHEVIIW